MKKTETIHYTGQGYIYRCPECNKVDRRPSVKETATCRFCEKEFKVQHRSDMTQGLYSVIQEINYLETGTVFGASPEMLKDDPLVKAGKSVGIDVLSSVNQTKPKEDSYFDSWRINKKQLAKLLETDEGKEIFEGAKKLMMNAQRFMEDDNAKLCKEVWEEARLRVLMKKNKGLTNNQKIALLKAEGFGGFNNDIYIKKGKVTIFFGSTYAPECDSWVTW